MYPFGEEVSRHSDAQDGGKYVDLGGGTDKAAVREGNGAG